MRRKHPKDYDQFVLLSASEEDDNSFDKRVLEYIIDTAAPVSTVERPSFRNLFKGTRLQVMSRPKLMKELDARYKKMTGNIRNVLTNTNYVCTTADVWSTKHRSFFGYTCHWVDKQFKRHSVALACKRFFGVHSYDHLTDTITNVNSEFNLSHSQIVATVTDNGSNFVKAFKEFGVHHIEEFDESLDDLEEIPESVELCSPTRVLPRHLRCASHKPNLLASSDFAKIVSKDESLKIRHTEVKYKSNEQDHSKS